MHPNRKQKLVWIKNKQPLAFHTLHAVSSMVDNHFYDLAFYYHWHQFFDVWSEWRGCNCWQRSYVCKKWSAFQCKVIQHAADSSQQTTQARIYDFSSLFPFLCLCVFFISAFSVWATHPKVHCKSKSTVPVAFMSHKDPILLWSRPPVCSS